MGTLIQTRAPVSSYFGLLASDFDLLSILIDKIIIGKKINSCNINELLYATYTYIGGQMLYLIGTNWYVMRPKAQRDSGYE